MISRDGPHAELLVLCGAVRDGNLSTEQFQRLESLLQESAEARQIYVQFIQLDAYFARQDQVALQQLATKQDEPPPPGAVLFDLPGVSADGRGGMMGIADEPGLGFDRSRPASAGPLSEGGLFFAGYLRRIKALFSRPVPLAICASLVSAIVVLTAERIFNLQPDRQPPSVVTSGMDRDSAPSSFVATLVSTANCRWDKTRSTSDLVNGDLRPGQSLHLIEGVAMIDSHLPNGSAGKFQLEGPLAMTLADDGMPNLLYGKLSCEFSDRRDSFRLGTTVGRIVISGDSSLGVRASANEVEIHVFSGTATFDLWSRSLDSSPNQLWKAEAGASLRARIAADGTISIDRGTAFENQFVTPASLAASQLLISDRYVQSIREAKPVAYWRFEDGIDGVVRNEMSERFALRMFGDAIRLWKGRGSHSAEFGIAAGPGYLMSDDVFDGVIHDDYTVELWAKPTCFHHGALFSLIDWTPMVSPKGQHRVYLEVCGPRKWDYEVAGGLWESDPGRLFFVNRRSEVYSSSPYVVRKWQHLVALREGSSMRLYADGRLIATDENSEQLGSGMRVLMGQLFPPSRFVRDDVTARLFAGELDEVALYDRALSEDEIRRHVQLAGAESETAAAAPADY